MIIVYITCKNNAEARKISKHLLEKKLIACSNMHKIKSMYWWNGRIDDDSEVVIIAKSTEKNYSAIKKEVKNLHSYKIPCILKINADANDEYYKWVEGEAS